MDRSEDAIKAVREKGEAAFQSRDEKVQICRVWMLNIQVCAPADISMEELEERVNKLHPCGTESGWTRNEELDVKKNLSPVPCSDNPLRKHYILWA